MSRQATPFNAHTIGYLAFLAIATIAAYSGIFNQEVLRWDDKIYLNADLVQSLSMDNLISMLSVKHNGNRHPLTTLSLALDQALWDANPTYSKLTNLLLHLVNVVLFYVLSFLVLRHATETVAATNRPAIVDLLLQDRTRFAVYASLAAATLFSLHPQHVESVAWISERKGLLCSAFYLASLITYIKAAKERQLFYSRLTIVFVSLALISKPMAISLPVAFVLLDIYPLKKVPNLNVSVDTIKTLLAGKSIYILLSVASIVITLLYQEPQSSAVLGYVPRLLNAFSAYLHYLFSIFYPVDLSPFYPFQQSSLQPSLASIFSVLAFSGLVYAVVALYLKQIHFPLVVFIFYLVSLLPVIGIVKVGYQAMADRYAYLPTMWIYLLAGVAPYALFARLQKTGPGFIAPVVLAAVSLLLGATTYEQSRHWENDFRLWQRAIDIYPDSASFAYVNLAAAHSARGDLEMTQIGQLIDKAISISPREPYILRAAANYRGMIGDESKAFEYLLRIIEVAPYNTWAQTTVGDIYFSRGDAINAGNHYLAALEHGEDPKLLVYKLALVDFQLKRYREASAKLEMLSAAEMGEKERALQQQIQAAQAGSAQ